MFFRKQPQYQTLLEHKKVGREALLELTYQMLHNQYRTSLTNTKHLLMSINSRLQKGIRSAPVQQI